MDIIKNYHDKKWTLQLLDALYNNIDIISPTVFVAINLYLVISPFVLL
jgi:hypothetical protein